MGTTSPFLADFKHFLAPLNVSSFPDDASRKQALEAARSLVYRLEKPMDTMLRVGWNEVAHVTALKIGIDLGLFKALTKDDQGSKKTVDELAQTTKSDPALVLRIMRVLAANGTVNEVGEATYTPTEVSKALLDPRVSAAIDFRWFVTNPSVQTLPRFLAETSYQNPTNGRDGPFQYAFQTKLTHFDWVSQHPKEMKIFGNHMAGYTSQRGTWEEIYPVQERLLSSSGNEYDVILVDVGGGSGHDLARFASKFMPDAKTPRLVLQDLPEVVDPVVQANTLPPSIKVIGHSFFEPPLVKGVRAYYMHSVLHDWPDDEAIKILKALRPALLGNTADGHTPKLLLNENVLPSTGTKARPASLDLLMCAFHAASERSENQWKALLEQAGYRVVKIYADDAVEDAVIEAEAVGTYTNGY